MIHLDRQKRDKKSWFHQRSFTCLLLHCKNICTTPACSNQHISMTREVFILNTVCGIVRTSANFILWCLIAFMPFKNSILCKFITCGTCVHQIKNCLTVLNRPQRLYLRLQYIVGWKVRYVMWHVDDMYCAKKLLKFYPKARQFG